MKLFELICNFLVWLFTLNMTASEVSLGGTIVVRIVTFAISFGVVGALFKRLEWFNSKAMRIVYFIVSTIISFVLCYIVMLIETYWKFILLAIIAIAIICYIKERAEA